MGNEDSADMDVYKTRKGVTIPHICHRHHRRCLCKKIARCKVLKDSTRKIGNLLCKLAIYCVNFGVNFFLLKFCLCKKMTNMRYFTG